MYGLDSSDTSISTGGAFTGKFAGTSVTIILILIVLSFSGCVEPGMEEPDVIPDPTDVNITPDEPSLIEYTIDDDPMKELTVTSPAFDNGAMIPEIYTCDSDNINPSLDVWGIPDGVPSLLLIMDDPDAPSGTFTHWVVWNIRPDEVIKEDSIPGVEGVNDAGTSSYVGPCPPSGTHRYFFKFYALDTELDLEGGSELSTVEDAMDGHVVAYGELVGLYRRS
ncbi:YbhB/YbcL family Raf kinase inhibitor-like protein [Methanolobus sp. WCC4]|uniref:YbhB/YbcL family Raf kinase inhibitor-like protein n=1 Tax=Methanolobus sp. WCC4 TaxID=3125784 RepID=UPI0030F8CE13